MTTDNTTKKPRKNCSMCNGTGWNKGDPIDADNNSGDSPFKSPHPCICTDVKTVDNKEQSSFSQTQNESDKQWIKTVEHFKDGRYFWTNGEKLPDGRKYGCFVDERLLDQLRLDAIEEGYKKGVLEQFTTISKVTQKEIQEAKKELLDEIITLVKKDEKEYLKRNHIVAGFYCGGLVEELKNRAKTLGRM
jgi:hypothetical protein